MWIIVLTFATTPLIEIAYSPNGGPIATYATKAECLRAKTGLIVRAHKRYAPKMRKEAFTLTCRPMGIET